MPKQYKSFYFIIIISVIASLLLSFAETQLKGRQDYNVEVDRKKNVLKCVGLDISMISSKDIIFEYKKRIQESIITENGILLDNITISDINTSENKSTGQSEYNYKGTPCLPIYKSNNPEAVIIPISGKGLWSTLYGYFALEPDLKTVKGISFYKHKETPGLGGEIEKDWFQNNFIGKSIYNHKGEFVSVTVLKGKAINNVNGVDGISGATITSRGVTTFLKNTLIRYMPYFKRSLIKSKSI